MAAKVERLDPHVLDAAILVNEVGAWFTHSHPCPRCGGRTHRHDHRRRSKRGDWDHHPIDQAGGG